MSSPIPASLKTADIARFALRAGQLEKMDPVIAYWCNYWIVNQILAKNLHNSNEECMTYTLHIMDKLEKVKAEQIDNDAIVDDVAGKAYVEQFGLETLERAEKTMKQNRVSRQTADTLHAAATFLELCQIWGALEPDLASKIKFAKYHAVRIARAIKAGEDPNLSNPTVETPAPLEQPEIPSTNAEPPGLQNIHNAENQTHVSRQPTVEDVPDGHDQFEPHIAPGSLRDHSQSRSQNQDPPIGWKATSPATEDYYTLPPADENPPHGQQPPRPTHNQPDQDDYFPKDTNQPVATDSIFLPEIPSGEPTYAHSSGQPLTPTNPQPSPSHSSSKFQAQDPSSRPQPRTLESFPPPQMDEPPPPDQPPPASGPTYLPHQHLNTAPRNPPLPPSSRPTYPQARYPPQDHTGTSSNIPHPHIAHPPPPPSPQVPAPGPGQGLGPSQTQPDFDMVVPDEQAIMTAQKHARWAISALNFEDVKTAVRELKGALEALGVR